MIKTYFSSSFVHSVLIHRVSSIRCGSISFDEIFGRRIVGLLYKYALHRAIFWDMLLSLSMLRFCLSYACVPYFMLFVHFASLVYHMRVATFLLSCLYSTYDTELISWHS